MYEFSLKINYQQTLVAALHKNEKCTQTRLFILVPS